MPTVNWPLLQLCQPNRIQEITDDVVSRGWIEQYHALRSLLAGVLFLALASLNDAMAQAPPGWTQTFENGMRVARSRADASKSFVGVLVVPAQQKNSALKAWFESTATSKLSSLGTITSRAGLQPFQDWEREMFTVRDRDGSDNTVIAYGYASDAGYHVAYVLVPSTIDRNDARLREAVTYIVAVRRLGTSAPGVAAPKSSAPPSPASAPAKQAQPTPAQGRPCRTVTRNTDSSQMGVTCHGPIGGPNRYCYPTFTPGMRRVTERVCD